MADGYVLGSPQPSFWNWLTQFPITELFNGKNETGIDIGTPFHTPITSLTPGVVTGTGYYGGGGVVSVESIVNGAPAEVYYQHLDTISVSKGSIVGPGTQLGLSGGQLSGGSHPSTAQFSNGPHTEVGINAPYGSFWNPLKIGGNSNPLPWLKAVASGASSAGNGLNPLNPANWINAISGAFGLSDVQDFAWRAALIVGGMVLIVIGLLVFFSKQEGDAITVVSQQAGTAARAAAAAAA